MKNILSEKPFVVPTDGKLIEEHHGIATTNNLKFLIAHDCSSEWSEPFQTLNLKNTLISYKKHSY
jgi:hypothetical protein